MPQSQTSLSDEPTGASQNERTRSFKHLAYTTQYITKMAAIDVLHPIHKTIQKQTYKIHQKHEHKDTNNASLHLVVPDHLRAGQKNGRSQEIEIKKQNHRISKYFFFCVTI